MLHLSISSRHNYSFTLTNCVLFHCSPLYFSQFLDLYFNLRNFKHLLFFFIPVLINFLLSFIYVLLFLPVFDIISLDSAGDGILFYPKFLWHSYFPYFYYIYLIKFTFNGFIAFSTVSKKRPSMHCIESLFPFISVSLQEFSLCIDHFSGIELVILTAFFDQLFVVTTFNDLTLIQYHDAIGIANRG